MKLQLNSYGKYIHMFNTIFLMTVFRYIPPMDGLTTLGMEILGIFLGLIYGWTFCSMIWPSILGLLLLGLSDYSSVGTVFKEGIGHQTVIFIFFLYIFCGVIDKSGLMDVFGKYILSLKIAQGRPYILMLLMLFTSLIIGAVVSAVAAVILIWKVFYEICNFLGYQKGNKYVTVSIIGIYYAAIVGSTILPFKVYGAIMLGVYESITGATIGFLQYTLTALCLTVILILVYILMCKYIFRPDVSSEIVVLEKPNGITNLQKKILALIICMMIMYFLPSILPAHLFIVQLLNEFGTTGIMIFIVLLCLIIQDQGTPLLDIKSAVYAGMSWDIYFLLIAVFPISTAISSPDTGLSAFIVDKMSPVFLNHTPLIFCFLIIAIGGVLSNIISNGVTPLIMLSIMIPIAADMGMNSAMLTCLLSVVMMCVMIFPSGSPVAGLILGNEWLNRLDVFRYGSIVVLVTIILTVMAGVPIGNIVF